VGEATAKMNVADLRKILNLPDSPESLCETPSSKSTSPKEPQFNDVTHQRIHRVRRESMEQLSLIKVAVFFYVLFLFDVPTDVSLFNLDCFQIFASM
jgi:hypothetical protein